MIGKMIVLIITNQYDVIKGLGQDLETFEDLSVQMTLAKTMM